MNNTAFVLSNSPGHLQHCGDTAAIVVEPGGVGHHVPVGGHHDGLVPRVAEVRAWQQADDVVALLVDGLLVDEIYIFKVRTVNFLKKDFTVLKLSLCRKCLDL